MTNEIIRKLHALLAEPITTEAQAVYLLIQVRKIMDRAAQDKKELEKVYRDRLNVELKYEVPTYPSLFLYCNWVAHIGLDRGMAKDIVREVDGLYPRLVTGTLQNEEKAHFRARFSFQSFRAEFDQFLKDNDLPRFNDESWNAFLLQFLGVIQDCPMTCEAKGGSLKHVDKVMLISELNAKEVWSGTLPPIIWSLHLGDIHKFMVTANLKVVPPDGPPKPGEVP